MMKLVYVITMVAIFGSTNHLVLGEGLWPQNENLMGFWPMSNFYKARDVSGNKNDASELSGFSSSSSIGPFGDPHTSLYSTSTVSNGGIFQVVTSKAAANLSLAGLSSFTISFFIRNPGSSSGILQYLQTSGSSSSSSAFSIYTRNGDICYFGSGNTACWDNVINYNSWNYFAITFEANSNGTRPNCTIQLHGRFATMTQSRQFESICTAQQYSIAGIRLGATYSKAWSTSTLLSCVMIYNTALSESTILQNYESCRSVLNGAPCGSPRLPMSPVPQVPVALTRPGQFPWIASLRYSSNKAFVCAATIISPYWLLTAATCFTYTAEARYFVVKVGDHDLAVEEGLEKSHNVRSINFQRVPYATMYDIALVELSDPIDFGNAYVNDACLTSSDATLDRSTTAFLVGWGKNGRNAFASETALRYGTGGIMTNGSCPKTWSENNPLEEQILAGKHKNNVLCYAGHPDVTVPCKGDLGSPLTLVSTAGPAQKLVQVGIYSRRNQDCSRVDSKLPIFTRVAAFWPWIKSTIACVNPGIHYPFQCPMP